ncbi:MAG: acyl carrier protein [Steroidobacteraceae bacterium]
MQIVAETAGVDPSAIKPESTIQALGVASLDAIDMIFKIEEVFGIELGDRELDLKAASVATLVQAVERAVGPGGALVATPAG